MMMEDLFSAGEEIFLLISSFSLSSFIHLTPKA